jgi:hypothetical protein
MGAASPRARRSLLVAALALSLGGALLLPATAGATIYPQKSIARVKLGMTKSQVRAKLGHPVGVRRKHSYITFSYSRLSVTFRTGSGVVSVQTTRPRERTSSGVGVGSKERQVRREVEGISCALYGSRRRCRVGSGEPGSRATDFLLRGGRVHRILLAWLADRNPPTTPTAIAVTGVTRTSISLAWQPASDAGGVASYGLYRDDFRIGAAKETNATFAGLACGATYFLQLDAADRSGNRSGKEWIEVATTPCPVVGDLLVSPSGSDANACTQTAPCLTLDRAYRVAKPGQVVDVADGIYPGQAITHHPAKIASADVVIRGSGGDASFTGTLRIYASHIDLRGIAGNRVNVTPNPYPTDTPPTDVTLRDVEAKGFDIMSSRDVRVLGGDYGTTADYGSHVKSCASCKYGSRNILISGVKIHDVVKKTPGAHVDCLHVWNTNGIVIRDSVFANCEHFNILFTWTSSHTGKTPDNIIIENNFLECCRSGYYSVLFGDGHGEVWRNVLMRNNSTTKNFVVGSNSTNSRSNLRFFANIAPSLPFGMCGRVGIVLDYNIWSRGSKCGAHDAVAPNGFRDPANLDFRLVDGAVAIDAAHPRNFAVRDIDRNIRPAGAAPDAGGWEHP